MDRSAILAAVDRSVYNRGVQYLRDGRVTLRDVGDGSASATVRGTEDYTVSVSFTGGKFSGRCSCPHMQWAVACKHIVCVGLAYLADPKPRSDTVTVEAFLSSLTKEELVARMMSLAAADNDLFISLRADALYRSEAAARDIETAVTLVEDALASALASRRQLRGIETAAAMLARLEEGGRLDIVREASAAAIRALVSHGELADEEDDGFYGEWEDDGSEDDGEFDESPDMDHVLPFVRIHARSITGVMDVGELSPLLENLFGAVRIEDGWRRVYTEELARSEAIRNVSDGD